MSELNQEVRRALAALDDDWDLEAARGHVRARVAAHAASTSGATPLSGRRPRRVLWGLGRAAAILLLTAAGAYALPGSPVRSWIRSALDGEAPVAATATPTTPAAPESAKRMEGTGVRLSVPSGALRVVLRDAAPGAEIRVALVPGTEAAVYAPAGSRFTSATGRVEARLAPGEVRVELPTGVDPVSLEVGGRTYLRSTDAGLDVSGPVISRTADEILFRVPGN